MSNRRTAAYFIDVTPGPDDIDSDACSAIMVDFAGTLTLENSRGDLVTVVVVAGQNNYETRKITAASGPTLITALF